MYDYINKLFYCCCNFWMIVVWENMWQVVTKNNYVGWVPHKYHGLTIYILYLIFFSNPPNLFSFITEIGVPVESKAQCLVQHSLSCSCIIKLNQPTIPVFLYYSLLFWKIKLKTKWILREIILIWFKEIKLLVTYASLS